MEGFFEYFHIILAVFGLAMVLQVLVATYLLAVLRASSKERQVLNKELFGLTKKIEGLTANRREQILRHFDQLVENLSTRLPTLVASRASEAIFEIESKVLRRLAELEPELSDNTQSKERMDELIKSMERLEHTVVALTTNTVNQILMESRGSIVEQTRASRVASLAINQ